MVAVPGADGAFCYITTTGRRTGRPHTIEIWFAVSGRTVYVLAGGRQADWVRNLRADPRATVRLGDERFPAVARIVEGGSDEDRLARRLVVDKYQDPRSRDLERWGATALPVAFDLEASSTGGAVGGGGPS